MLENSDVLYRLLVQGVEDHAIYLLTPEGIVANWNIGAERAKGYRSAEIVGKHFSCFYSPDDRAACVPQRGLEHARSHGFFEAEGWRYRKDGSAFWAHVTIRAIHDGGSLVGFAKITRDMSEHRKREQQLVAAKELAERYSEEMASLSSFLNTVVTHMPSAVIVQDAVTRQVMLINTQAERLFGSACDITIGRTARACLPPQISHYVETLADTVLRTGDMLLRHEENLQTSFGMRTVRSNTMIISSPDLRQSFVMTIADDVTDEISASAQIHYMAHHDALTGLPNRLLFRERLNESLRDDAARQQLTAVLCLDVDHFKNVNDGLGHQVGDELLRALAARLRKTLREEDTLARLGGDEFAVVLPAVRRPDDAYQAALRLIDVMETPFQIDGHLLSAGLSVGMALAPIDHLAADQLLRYADMALYEAKRNGRHRLESFRSELDDAARKRRVIENDLREAIANGQLRLYYQPITDRDQSRITGYEALMRWEHPQHGLVMPLDFIPIAEETGLIHPLGSLALHDACHEAAKWPDKQSVAVNLSPVQFRNGNLVAVVEAALVASGLEANRLELEVTESVLLENTDANIDLLKRLKALGVRIALDDFGTGYSSLSYLRSFPFDKIKIDKSFTRDMHESREAMAIIRAIIGMSRSLEIQATAEGVETEGQYEYLMAEGCNQFQGYFFGVPQPPHARKASVTTASA